MACQNDSPCLVIPRYIQEGVFTGPDSHSLLRDEVFERIITDYEQRAWLAFREVVTGFLGNRRADNYKDLMEELLSYQKRVQYVHENPLTEFSSGLLSGELLFCE
jgi:hypothetical protein